VDFEKNVVLVKLSSVLTFTTPAVLIAGLMGAISGISYKSKSLGKAPLEALSWEKTITCLVEVVRCSKIHNCIFPFSSPWRKRTWRMKSRISLGLADGMQNARAKIFFAGVFAQKRRQQKKKKISSLKVVMLVFLLDLIESHSPPRYR
jgi:hypothetical protein